MVIRTIQVRNENDNTYRDYRQGTTLFEMSKDVECYNCHPFVGAFVNNQIRTLDFQIFKPKTIRFIDVTEYAGMRIYIRSLCFVLYKAIKDLVPESKLTIEHPISNGYYFVIEGEKLDAQAIKRRMQELIVQDIPIEKKEAETQRVIELFKEQGLEEKVSLLEHAGEVYSTYYKLGDTINDFFGLLLPSTGLLNVFDVSPYYEGFLLRGPSQEDPNSLVEFFPQTKIFEIFKEHSAWNKILGFSYIGELNKMCKEGDSYGAIKIAEALHEKKIAQIADQIVGDKNKKIVLVSGPSSSGKTTFSKRLSVQLMVNGKKPVALSVDDYFLSREHTPVDENGEYDFESLYAVDLARFNSDLSRLIAGEQIQTPRFNFNTGQSEEGGHWVQLDEDSVLVIEGIHALNPLLTSEVKQEMKFSIYVSALTTYSFDRHNWISTSDTRLVRRIIRDHNYRGYSAIDTIKRWKSVQEGERKWIFPFQENADAVFNSSLIFELSVLKPLLDPILRQVPKSKPEYDEARRLLGFSRYFIPMRASKIPLTSLLREFVGGSSFEY